MASFIHSSQLDGPCVISEPAITPRRKRVGNLHTAITYWKIASSQVRKAALPRQRPPWSMIQGALSTSSHESPKSTISVEQQSNASCVGRPTVEQPTPPHWPHASTQHARPLEDSTPGIPLLQKVTSPPEGGTTVTSSVVGDMDVITAAGAGEGNSTDTEGTSNFERGTTGGRRRTFETNVEARRQLRMVYESRQRKAPTQKKYLDAWAPFGSGRFPRRREEICWPTLARSG